MSYIPGDYVIVDGQLYHHGTKGMRWGVRRYQNKDGSLTPEGRKRYGSGDFNPIAAIKKYRHDKKVKKQRQAALEKAREAKVEKKNHEEEKQKAIRSGDANEVLKFKDELTQQERQEAIGRIRWEQDMKNLAPKDVQAGQSRIDKVMKNIDTATTHVNTGIKAWNTFANVVNATNHEVMLPKIDTNITSGNRDAVKAFKKEKEKASKKSDKFDLKKIYEDRDKQSDEDLSKALKRANTEKAIKKMVDDDEAAAKEAKLKAAQKQVDDYNAELAKQNETPKSEPYHMKGNNVIDSKWESNNKSTIDRGNDFILLLEDKQLKHSDDLSHAEWKDHKYIVPMK